MSVLKDEIKRELAEILPEDTSTDLITRLATYVEERLKEAAKFSND